MFGEQVRWHRRRLGLTQEEVSAATGVNVRTIGKIEGGQIGRPRQSTVRVLADAFGLSGADRERFVGRNAATPGPGGGPAVPVPAQLPADLPLFVGRSGELAQLTGLLDARLHAPSGRSALITAIGGTAGVGKTALAVHWGQSMRDRFPDGQLYVNLRGYDPDQPMSAGDALAAFLRALGVPAAEVPLDVEERAAAYRSLVDGRRMLVVLDNASSVDQVRHLLPACPTCFALVTSRDSLGGLVARYGATRIELDLLSLPDSLGLLRSMIGHRVDDEPAAASTLAEQCVRLPLALRVGAERAVARPESSLATLAAELGDRERRLDMLDAGGDARTAVRAVFSWSYDSLPPEAARLFRLLSLHPGADFDRYAAASLADLDPAGAERRLDQLVRAYLVRRTADRYTMHDLLRSYAAAMASTVDSGAVLEAAWTRMVENYLATAAVAVRICYGEDALVTSVTVGPSAGPDLPHVQAGQAWLHGEVSNLVAVCGQATTRWRWDVVPRLSSILGRPLLLLGSDEALFIHSEAMRAARTGGDRSAEARALSLLGATFGQRGRLATAAEHLEQAVRVSREAGEGVAEALALRGLANTQWFLGNRDRAIELGGEAIAAARRCGETVGEANATANLATYLWRQGRSDEALRILASSPSHDGSGWAAHTRAQVLTTMGEIHLRQGRDVEAETCAQRALAIAQRAQDPTGEAVALRDLGTIRLHRGDCDGAADLLQRAAAQLERAQPNLEAQAVSRLGEVRRRQARHAEAVSLQERALEFFRRVRDSGSESEVLNRLGLVRLDLGEVDTARVTFTAALDRAQESGFRYEQATAYARLGRVHAAAGRPDAARVCWLEALAIYDDLAVPEATEIRALLTSD